MFSRFMLDYRHVLPVNYFIKSKYSKQQNKKISSFCLFMVAEYLNSSFSNYQNKKNTWQLLHSLSETTISKF